MSDENVSATLTVDAPAARVFAVLTDPTTHASIDGTGWVTQCLEPAPLAEVGQIFRMGMYHRDHPSGRYRTVNRVEVFSAPNAIAWITGQELDSGGFEFGGWVWRYDLTPLDPTRTRVTHSYDWSAVPPHIRARGIQFPPFGPDHLANSLRHLAALAT